MQILLADDHAIVRSGLCRIVTEEFPGVTVGEVSAYQELHTKIQEKHWSVLILDIALGNKNSLDLVPELCRLNPDMKIIVLSMYNEKQFALRALRCGILGYVTKDRAPEELLQAIRNVLQGKRYVCETIASQIAEHVALTGSNSETLHESLSSREYEIFLLLASARSVSEIAAQLSLSVKTISTYRSRILEKLGLCSNAQLMRYAIDHNLAK